MFQTLKYLQEVSDLIYRTLSFDKCLYLTLIQHVYSKITILNKIIDEHNPIVNKFII